MLAIVLMINHPTAVNGAGPAGFVHGSLQLCVLIQVAVFTLATQRLAQGRLFRLMLVVLPFVAGSAAGLIAATINGFAVPTMLAYPAPGVGPDVKIMAWELNQVFARLGVIACGIGIAGLSAMLWQHQHRLVALAGFAAGLIPAILLLLGHTDMKLFGAILAYSSQLAWLALLGGWLARRA
ncbi:MAG: hypothetical protein IE921_06650 [Rhodobacteraceae bacterium]|nr:hypothetical protein [Paracoccaceae bacterium]